MTDISKILDDYKLAVYRLRERGFTRKKIARNLELSYYTVCQHFHYIDRVTNRVESDPEWFQRQLEFEGLDKRTKNALIMGGYDSKGKVAGATYAELFQLSSIGRGSMDAIYKWLGK